MTERVLLIDGDIVAYEAASAVEKAIEWEPGYWTWHVDYEEAQEAALARLSTFVTDLEADRYELALTDDGHNWRKDVLPSYKGNRARVKKPLVLKAIKQWMVEEFSAWMRPGLEGDDILGILATHPKLIRGEKVIVSIDKDMKTIPGKYVRRLEDGIIEVSEEEADWWHMFQTLTGDQTDGYSGCPGIGPKKAEAILAHSTEWPHIVSVYEKAGLTEAHALQQARVARILRASDYDFKAKKPILWTP